MKPVTSASIQPANAHVTGNCLGRLQLQLHILPEAPALYFRGAAPAPAPALYFRGAASAPAPRGAEWLMELQEQHKPAAPKTVALPIDTEICLVTGFLPRTVFLF